MLKSIHQKVPLQLTIGFFAGIIFGFLLQKGGVTNYDVIIGQLLLTDFTVIKIMLSAVVTGMIGIHLLRDLELVQLHPKNGSLGSSVIGGLIFGVGFGILGYCPGTLTGAVGQGFLDALFGGMPGILIGTGLFAEFFPKLDKAILNKGRFSKLTWPELLEANHWVVIVSLVSVIIALLLWVEKAGL
jgi:hypothetical protein